MGQSEKNCKFILCFDDNNLYIGHHENVNKCITLAYETMEKVMNSSPIKIETAVVIEKEWRVVDILKEKAYIKTELP